MSGDLDTLLRQFLRERKYLRNLRPQTLEWYDTAWKGFRKSATHSVTDPGIAESGTSGAVCLQPARPGREAGDVQLLAPGAQCLLPLAARERPASNRPSTYLL